MLKFIIVASVAALLPPTSLRPCCRSLRSTSKPDDGGIGQVIENAAKALEGAGKAEEKADPARRARALRRVGWLCWWTQIILSVISAVVLGFARLGSDSRNASLLASGFFFSACGLAASFASVGWCWHYTRLARRDESLDNVRSALRFGVILNLSGMAATLFSAQQVVGSLITKLLLTPGSFTQLATPGTTALGVGALRPVSLFCARLTRPRRSPPSTSSSCRPTPILCAHSSQVCVFCTFGVTSAAGTVASLSLLDRSRKW